MLKIKPKDRFPVHWCMCKLTHSNTLCTMRKIILIVISITLIISVGYFLANNLDYRTNLSSWLSIPSDSFVEANNIKKVEIELSKDDKLHYERLFQDYHGEGIGPENELFVKYYSENNIWKKTNLIIDKKKYEVKIKSHGRTPYAHKYGDNFSLAIKFLDNPYPFFSKRINLVIYNRIQLKSEILKLMALKFNLIHPNFELVSAKVGDKENYFYFVEERINEDFFIKRNLPMVIFNKGLDGSLICFNYKDKISLNSQLEKELKKRNQLSPELKTQIKVSYQNFNTAIINNNVDELKKYIDIDYFSRLNAFRTIYGSDGHGFSNLNLEMAYDTISSLFYPIVHRDVNSTTLTNCQEPYSFMDSTRAIIPFWLLLDSDSVFLQMTNEKIESFFLKNSLSSLTSEFDDLINYYKSSHIFEFSYMNNGMNGTTILENFKCLNNLHNTK